MGECIACTLIGFGLGYAANAALRSIRADALRTAMERDEQVRKKYEASCPIPEGVFRFDAEGGYHAVQVAGEGRAEPPQGRVAG